MIVWGGARAPFRFTTLRSRLFAAIVGVLILSLLLTGAIFWLQIRLLNTQRVRADLLNSAPTVRMSIDRDLVRYWQATLTNPASMQQELIKLKEYLVRDARAANVRVLLTDYCNNIAIDTASAAPLRALTTQRVPSTCSRLLDDMDGDGNPQPISLNITPDGSPMRQIQQTSLPGSGQAFYIAFPAPLFYPYAQREGGAYPLLVRTIVIANPSSNIDQDALTSILPRLAAAAAFALLLSLVVVALIVRAIIRPLRTITAASERMARGDYDQRVPDGGEDEVGQLARSFNHMAMEVSGAREHQRQFIANVSHDLKTPLTSILGFSQILTEIDGTTTPMQQRAARVINEEARRLQRLTLDLLDLSRLEAGQLQMRFAACDLNEMAGEALLRYAQLPANSAITFLDQRIPGALMVRGDPDRLMQVLVNLLDNAVKFCDPRGSVAILTRRAGAAAVLTVANTGAGIAEEDLARVFQRFYRTDHSRSMRTGGAGLGLAIVHEIVVAHNGDVEAHGGADGWTRFTVRLPGMDTQSTFDRLPSLRDTEPDTAIAP